MLQHISQGILHPVVEAAEMSIAKVSIIIPTCNRPNELAVCLNALKPQLSGAGRAEVLVLDDGTCSASREMVATEFPWVSWHAGPRRGPAANRNAGAALARGEWLIFLDDDCVPRDRLLLSYMEAMQAAEGKSPCVFIGPTFSPMKERTLLSEAPYNPQGEVLISCNFALSHQLFHELGGFDDRYPVAAFEDTEFEARVRCLCIPVLFVPKAAIDHPLRRVSSPKKLAHRWEGRVIYALDQGAKPFCVITRLPWHVLRVIQSRFSTAKKTREDLIAVCIFVIEWLHVIFWTPSWVRKWSRRPRSPFWVQYVAKHGPAPNFGF